MLKAKTDEAQKYLDVENPPVDRLIDLEKEITDELEKVGRGEVVVELELIDYAQSLLQDIKKRIGHSRLAVSPKPSTEQPPQRDSFTDQHTVADNAKAEASSKVSFGQHDPIAEKKIDQAEEALFAGRYKEAIRLFNEVLSIEPGWERALEHRKEAEEYLRTGKIPEVALPPEAARLYGRAQSAARVYRFDVALGFLDEAFRILEANGIKKWEDGAKLRQQLDLQKQAQEIYQEGLAFYEQCEFESAISKFRLAYNAAPIPEYDSKIKQTTEMQNLFQNISAIANQASLVPADKLAQAKRDLDGIGAEFGDVPRVSRLRNMLDLAIPGAIKSIRDRVKTLRNQAESATTLEQARSFIEEAQEKIADGEAFGKIDEQLSRLKNEISQMHEDINSREDELLRALKSLSGGNKLFPVEAVKLSGVVRRKYPNDPKVLELSRNLAPYHFIRTAGIGIGILLGLIILYFLVTTAFHQVTAYIHNLTPTITPTITLTPTITETPVPTLTLTVTPTLTMTPSLTPTPMVYGCLPSQAYLRKGCYDNFEALILLQANSRVLVLDEGARKKDDFGRECALVKFEDALGQAFTGYLLYSDLDRCP